MGRISKANIKKTIYYLKRNGVRNTWYAAKERMESGKEKPYHYQAPAEEVLEQQRRNAPAFGGVISIVVPTYHTNSQYLRELINSVQEQTYSYWELLLADATEGDSVRKVVGEYSDRRIRYIPLEKNAGIAENTNCALQYVTGEFVGLLDHDDVLTADALYEIAACITDGVRLLYSDEDKCDGDGIKYFDANFKEDFNINLLLSNNYICHFMVMDIALIKKLEFRSEYDGAQDYDLMLRAVKELWGREEQVVHIPRVLYHWRCHTGSTAENPQSKQYAYEAGRKALQDFADSMEWNAKAVHLKHLGFYRLEYQGDIFDSRVDLGAVGGRILAKGKVSGGRMTEAGKLLYEGLPAAYSGYMNRAVLTQDADAVDIRCIRIRKECIPIFEKITNVPYKEEPDTMLFNVKLLPQGTDYHRLSLELGKALREAGYRILYDPAITRS